MLTMIKSAKRLPVLLIICLSVSFIVEFVVHVTQIVHLSKFNVESFENPAVFAVLSYVLDTTKLSSLKLAIDFAFMFIIMMLLGSIWNWIHGIYLFTMFLAGLKFIFVDLPFAIIQSAILSPKYKGTDGFDSSVIVTTVNTAISGLLAEMLLILILNCIGKCTDLENMHGEMNENETEDLNDEVLTPLTNIDEEPTPLESNNRGIMFGKFWLVCFVIIAIIISLVTCFLPSILLLEGDVYTPFSSYSQSAPVKNISDLAGFSFENILISNSARDQGSPNAYLAGIIKEKIFVTQSIINWMSTLELTAVIGHELGHWIHQDLLKGLFLSVTQILLICLIIRFVTRRGLSELSINDEMPVCVILFVVVILTRGLTVFMTPLSNSFMRMYENNADCYSAKLGLPIGEALQHLMELAKQTFESAPLYTFYYENHPPLSTRLEGIQKCLAK